MFSTGLEMVIQMLEEHYPKVIVLPTTELMDRYEI